jgi:hypothetical protein
MKRGSPTAGQLRLRTYQRFSDLPPSVAGYIITHLGLAGGKMRRDALRYDPRTIVAYWRRPSWISQGGVIYEWRWQPIGWLTLSPASASRPQLRRLQTFVVRKRRRQGVGSRMLALCHSRWLRSRETVFAADESPAAKAFWHKNGVREATKQERKQT